VPPGIGPALLLDGRGQCDGVFLASAHGNGTFGAAAEVIDVAVDAPVAIDLDSEQRGARDVWARALRRLSRTPRAGRPA
jgi:hypothetical protein